MNIIREMLRTPEAQKEPHYWGATFSGHSWLALGPWGAAAIIFDRWTAAWLVPLCYLILWEGLQLLLAERRTRYLYWDAVTDTVAVAFGCYAAAMYGDGMLLEALGAWSASIVVIAVGMEVRR